MCRSWVVVWGLLDMRVEGPWLCLMDWPLSETLPVGETLMGRGPFLDLEGHDRMRWRETHT